MGIDQTIKLLSTVNATREVLEQLDVDITYVFNVAGKEVEGPTRRVPYSKTKMIAQNRLLYWKRRQSLKRGRKINREKLEERRIVLDMKEKEMSMNAIEIKCNEAKSQQKIVVEYSKRIKEEELLDTYLVVIKGEDDKVIAK